MTTLTPFVPQAFRAAWLREPVKEPKDRFVGFTRLKVEQQCFADWCWAAAAVSVRRQHQTKESQCDCVARVRDLAVGTCCGWHCAGADHPVPECAGGADDAYVREALGDHLGDVAQFPANLAEISADLERFCPVILGLDSRDHLVVAFSVIGEDGDGAVVRCRDPLQPLSVRRVEYGWGWLKGEVAMVFRSKA